MVTINGKEVKLRLDLGTMKLLKKEHGINFFSMEDGMDPIAMGALILSAAKRAGSELTEEDVDCMTMGEFTGASKWLEREMVEFLPDPTDEAKNKKRRN